MLADKVIYLDVDSKYIFSHIEMFIKRKGLKSENTACAYLTDIRDFFMKVKNKNINELTLNDLRITYEDFESYILMLDDEGLTGGTINRKVAAMTSFLEYLQPINKYKSVIDTSFFKQIERLPDNSRGYDVLTREEVEIMANLAKQEREKGLIKYYLLLFSADTCIRQTAILKLKWYDFKDLGGEVEIRGVDKGNKHFKTRISKEFYNELLKIRDEKSEYVFNISSRTISRMMDRLKQKMNFENRYIVFHSFRKSGITFRWNLTKDPLAVMDAGNHSSFDTTKKYIKEDKYGAIGMFSSLSNVDLNVFNNMTKEELLNLIYSSRKDIQIQLAIAANNVNQ